MRLIQKLGKAVNRGVKGTSRGGSSRKRLATPQAWHWSSVRLHCPHMEQVHKVACQGVVACTSAASLMIGLEYRSMRLARTRNFVSSGIRIADGRLGAACDRPQGQAGPERGVPYEGREPGDER